MPTPHVGDPVDVHVNPDAFCAVPGDGHGKVGHFGTNTGEGGESFDGGGNIAVPLVAENDGCLLEIPEGRKVSIVP